MIAARQAARHDEPVDSIELVANALADRTRREVLRLVRDHELSAGQLAEHFQHMSRPAVSQHLRVLQSAELVTVRAEGNHRLYRARSEGLAAMWDYIDEMWTDRLARLKHAAERAEWPEQQRRNLQKGSRS